MQGLPGLLRGVHRPHVRPQQRVVEPALERQPVGKLLSDGERDAQRLMMAERTLPVIVILQQHDFGSVADHRGHAARGIAHHGKMRRPSCRTAVPGDAASRRQRERHPLPCGGPGCRTRIAADRIEAASRCRGPGGNSSRPSAVVRRTTSDVCRPPVGRTLPAGLRLPAGNGRRGFRRHSAGLDFRDMPAAFRRIRRPRIFRRRIRSPQQQRRGIPGRLRSRSALRSRPPGRLPQPCGRFGAGLPCRASCGRHGLRQDGPSRFAAGTGQQRFAVLPPSAVVITTPSCFNTVSGRSRRSPATIPINTTAAAAAIRGQ